MTTDDKMREIDAALDYYDEQWKDGRDKLLALIRAAIAPQATEPNKKVPGAFAKLADAMRPHLEAAAAEAERAAKVSEWNTVEHGKQADAEHEAKVEAWQSQATEIAGHCGIARDLVLRMRDEGASLMRVARPTTEAGPSAMERLRAKVDDVASDEDISMEAWHAFDRVLDWIDEEKNNG